MRTDYRTYKIEVSSGNNGTGTYQLKVRVNNICRINDDGDVQYQWAGGPEGYPAHSDLPAGTGGRQVLLAGTDWGNNNVPDRNSTTFSATTGTPTPTRTGSG